MADDITLNTGSGGSVVATDEITNRHYQKNKLTFGADGTATDVGSKTSNPFPVGFDRTQAQVEAAPSSDVIMVDGVEVTVERALISTAAAATATLVAATPAKKIRVLAVFIANTTAQSLTFKSAAGGTAKTGAMPLATLGQLALPFNAHGWFETIAGELLELAQSGSTTCFGVLTYALI